MKHLKKSRRKLEILLPLAGVSFLVTLPVGVPLSNALPSNPTITRSDRVETIRFAPGTNYAEIRGGNPRGESTAYTLDARRDQYMTVSIGSIEANGVFDVSAPDGSVLVREATRWTGNLPASGRYRVVV